MALKRLAHVAALLGYAGDPGYVLCDAFDYQPNHRHALRLAENRMRVRSAFGLKTGGAGALTGPDHPRFTPLVFLATASDDADAREVHRRVWSQGLAPHLLVATPEGLWMCEGFAFSSSHWRRHATFIGDQALAAGPGDRLAALSARSLRSSIAWRDEARSGDDFVDTRLLKSLADLSQALSRASAFGPVLMPAATNGLIARLLYFYFLLDRGFINAERLAAWGLNDIGIGTGQDQDWPLEATRRLFTRLDEVFNGSIFPMRPEHEASLDALHVNSIRRVLRHGAQPAGEGLQLSFLDYDFASIRTETLSAIYEMFLHNEEAEAGRKLGAFYTPPFLVDYVLDRLEDERPLVRGVRVLDPAAGSGVFLVGAYRRIVEASLPRGAARLPLRTLHDLMTSSIFGVELNDTACHVAAFSLYLTMLDYADPQEAADFTNWPILTGQPRLFPPMLSARDGRSPNIRAGDFFSAIAEDLSCEVVVGNPPWVQIPNLGTLAALNYERSHRRDAPIGDRQSAELFTWKALNEHLVEDGVLAFLLPLKSLVNRLSSAFAGGLRNRCEIVGVSDLAHLRYVLFRRSGAARGARQSTAAVLLRKREPRPDHQFWTFRPLRPTQPATRNGRLWTLIHDWTQVQWSLQAELDEAQWIQVFTCSTVDRRILRQIDRQARSGRLSILGDLKDRYGLEFRIEVDKNLDREFVLGTNERSPNYWLTQLGFLDPPLGLGNATGAVPLPQAQVDKGIPSVRAFLQGNLVVMSRNCERAVFVEPPAAFSFLVLAGFPAYAGGALPQAHRRFLQALAAYMSTDVFRYLCFVSSPRMMIDRASIELSTVRQQPWPLGAPGDDRVETFLSADAEGREALSLQALGVPDILGRAISEFSTFREAYRDGGNPPEGLRGARADELTAYAETVLAEVDRGKGRYRTSLTEIEGAGLTALTLTYVGDEVASPTAASAIERALSEYQAEGASSLSQTRYLWHSRDDMQTVLLKPAERLHWTRDRAFGDADLITAAIMSRFSGRVAA